MTIQSQSQSDLLVGMLCKLTIALFTMLVASLSTTQYIHIADTHVFIVVRMQHNQIEMKYPHSLPNGIDDVIAMN